MTPEEQRQRKKILYEAARILDRLAETERYPEDGRTRFVAKILRKEGREPGAIQRWIDLPSPRTRGILGKERDGRSGTKGNVRAEEGGVEAPEKEKAPVDGPHCGGVHVEDGGGPGAEAPGPEGGGEDRR